MFAWPCFWRPQASASVPKRPQASASVPKRPQASASVRERPQPFATVRNRPQPSVCGRRGLKVAVHMGKVAKTYLFLTCQKIWSCRFAWQAWHFVTFQHVSQRVKSRFVWQAQYFSHVFTRCVAFFVAGAALWRPPMSFCNKPFSTPK